MQSLLINSLVLRASVNTGEGQAARSNGIVNTFFTSCSTPTFMGRNSTDDASTLSNEGLPLMRVSFFFLFWNADRLSISKMPEKAALTTLGTSLLES